MFKSYKGIFLILAGAALWGTSGIFVRNLENFGFSAMQLVFCRAFFSVVILTAIILVRDRKLFKIKVRDLWCFAGSGLFSIVMFNYCYYKTMSLTSLSVAAVLLYTAPFFVAVMSVFIFGEHMNVRKIVSCICAFIGCCFVSGLFSGGHTISRAGLIYGIITGFGYSLYTIFGELLIRRGYNSLTITFYTFVFATAGCLPFLNPADTAANLFQGVVPFFIAASMSLFNTVFPYLLYTSGLKTVEPAKAPIIATIEPVVATVVGTLVFSEPLTLSGIIGIVLVVGSVIILNFKAGDSVEGVKSQSKCKN